MGIEKIRNAMRERISSQDWKDWAKFDKCELTARAFYYLAGYAPETTLGEALELMRQLDNEQMKERGKNE